MSKMKLGNDFQDEGAKDTDIPEDGVKDEDIDVDIKDEKDDSADSPDSKKDPTDPDDTIDEDKDDGAKDDADEDDSDKSKDEKPTLDKKTVLQGLLDTEKELDTDDTDLDTKIAQAKTRITQKRGIRREKRDLVSTIDVVLPIEDEEVDDLSDIDGETLKVLERFTKAKGLVPKSELEQISYQTIHKTAEESFYNTHPEYLPDNDPGDVLYKALKDELSNFATPKDPKKISALFERAHIIVKQNNPDKFKGTTKEVKKDDKDTIDKDTNKSVRLKSQGVGGGTGDGGGKGNNNSEKAGKKTYSEVQIRALQDGGWSDEDIKRLTS